MEKYDKIFLDIIDKYGRDSQHKMLVGEIGELLSLFGKAEQGRATHENWIDEIADVTIMMRQMAYIYGVEDIEKRIDFKIKRLKKKL